MKRIIPTILLALSAASIASYAHGKASSPDLTSVKKIYIEPMPNGLDQYIRAEIFKQLNGEIAIVTDKNDAEAIMSGTDEEDHGVGKAIGTYTGMADTASAAISLLSLDGKTVLWSAEAGDRSLLFTALRRKGERKLASRIVEQLKKAMNR